MQSRVLTGSKASVVIAVRLRDAPEVAPRFVDLCWDGNGGWTQAHARVLGSVVLVEELESAEFSKLRMEIPIET
jgi:hypothetical protein